MSLFYNITAINAGYCLPPPPSPITGSNPYGGNFIQGDGYGDIIYGENSGYLYYGTIGGNTIYGGGGSNAVYGDAYGLYGSVTAHSNTIWADGPNANDSSAVNTIYGNACVMGADATAGTDLYGNRVGNTIYDSFGNTSYLYGNAYYMTDHAWGGHNAITALSSTSYVYGDAHDITGSTIWDPTRFDGVSGYGVSAGFNSITFDSASGFAYGDAYQIQGTFKGGSNTIWIGDQPNAIVYGTADTFAGQSISCGNNSIHAGSGNDTIYGDAYQNVAGSFGLGGNNQIYAGSGNDTIYGDCYVNFGVFEDHEYGWGLSAHNNVIYAGSGNDVIYGSCASNIGTFYALAGVDINLGNTIHAGSGSETIYGNCASNLGTFHGGHNTIYAGAGNSTIYGDCASNAGNFAGGHNTIYAGTGNVTMYGSATDGHNTFVFGPGAGVSQIGSRNGDGSVLQGFDQEGGAAFNHAQGDVIDVSALHLGGLPVVGANASGDAVIYLPPAGGSPAGQVTLVGVHPQGLTASDFHV
jgi:hypothetical protein